MDFANNISSGDNPFSDFCEIYLLYFDKLHGQVPFFTYPNSLIKYNAEKMWPINMHYIWWMDIKDQAVLDYIHLGYKNKIFFGRKFITLSKRKKNQSELQNNNYETVVIILALPNDISIFGGELLIKMTTEIIKNFEGKLYKIIESEIAEKEIIKTHKIKETIKKGEHIKYKLKILIETIYRDFFKSVFKQNDINSIKSQKAIAYFALKSIDIENVDVNKNNSLFSNINSFNSRIKSEEIPAFKISLSISNINIANNNQELEIIVQNNTNKEIKDINVNITHLKDFFEKKIMNQKIDKWFPHEKLLFIFPIIPFINEYHVVFNDNNEKLLSEKINLNKLKEV